MKPVLTTILFVLSFTALAFGATIGTITSNGRFELEGATIWNRGTVLEGTRIATGSAASRLQLTGGTDLRLGTSTHARVYTDRLLLESGSVQGSLPGNFRMETKALGLSVEGIGAEAQVKVDGTGKVLVASLQGALDVRGPQGILVAHLAEGNALELSASQGGATASTTLTGMIKNEGGKYLITDEVTNVTVEVRGADLAKYAGKRATVTGDIVSGAKPAPGAEYVVAVQSTKLPAAAAVAAAKTGSVSTLAKVVVVSGIAVAGGVTAGVVATGDDDNVTVSPQPK